MQSESSRPVRQSIAAKRVSVTSQKRSSYLPENQRQLDLKTTNFSDLQPVFDSASGSLTQLYVQSFNNVSKSGNKAMMHVGICLQSEQIFIFLKQLFIETGKSINALTRQFDRLRETKQLCSKIYFAPFWQYKIENCVIIFWILLSNNLQQIIRRSQYNAQLDLFVSYPQLIIINSSSYELLSGRKINLSQKLRFRQQICILKDRNLAINPQNSSRRPQQRQHSKYESQIHMVGAIVDKKSFLQSIPTIMKKNSIRCFNQLQKINLYLLQAISSSNSKLKQIKNQQPLKELENIQLQQVIDKAVSAYLSAQQQKQKQFPVLPHPQKQLETLLNSVQQQKMQNLRTNIRVLYHQSPQKQSNLLIAAEKKILLKNQQILMNNRQLTKKYNKELLNQLYEKLLGHFEKGKYGGKDKTQAMAEDLSNFIDEFGKKGIKSSTMFEIFNSFMKNNKAKYYDKIQELQQKIDENRKITNFDDIFDKIQMKKRVLVTLQKQVKNLEQKKLQVEQQNEHLKQYQKQINQRHLESEGDELAEADSIKTFKTKPLSSNSPRLMNRGYNKQMYGVNDNKKMEMMALNVQGKKKSKGKGKSKKKGCCSCRCNIF